MTTPAITPAKTKMIHSVMPIPPTCSSSSLSHEKTAINKDNHKTQCCIHCFPGSHCLRMFGCRRAWCPWRRRADQESPELSTPLPLHTHPAPKTHRYTQPSQNTQESTQWMKDEDEVWMENRGVLVELDGDEGSVGSPNPIPDPQNIQEWHHSGVMPRIEVKGEHWTITIHHFLQSVPHIERKVPHRKLEFIKIKSNSI